MANSSRGRGENNLYAFRTLSGRGPAAQVDSLTLEIFFTEMGMEAPVFSAYHRSLGGETGRVSTVSRTIRTDSTGLEMSDGAHLEATQCDGSRIGWQGAWD